MAYKTGLVWKLRTGVATVEMYYNKPDKTRFNASVIQIKNYLLNQLQFNFTLFVVIPNIL